MSLRHPKIKGINVAIKIIKPQAIPNRMTIATHLEVRMQFASISGTITALLYCVNLHGQSMSNSF